MPRRVERPEPPIGARSQRRAPTDGPPAAPPRKRPRRRLPLDPLPAPVPAPLDAPTLIAAGEGPTETWSAAALEVEGRPGRSPRTETCPFLRAADADGALGEPSDAVDERNRCSALVAPQPLGSAQQQLVCLTTGHVGCPRYLQGVAAVEAGLQGNGSRSRPPLAVAASFAVLGLTAIAVAAYMVASGGLALALPPASPSGGLSAAGDVTPTLAGSTAPATVALPTGTAIPTPSPAPAPTPTPTDMPMPTATPRPTTTVAPSPQPTATTIADRFRGLDRCAGAEVCYVYVVRSGDNLSSISNYFGSTLDEVLAKNPQIADPSSIHAGDEIALPPP